MYTSAEPESQNGNARSSRRQRLPYLQDLRPRNIKAQKDTSLERSSSCDRLCSLIPSILGMAACAILLVGIAIAAGPALIRGSGALAVVLSGSGIMADVLIGIGCFVGGLLGWLLVMKRDVLQCDNCGAVVNASATIKSHPNRSIARASVFGFFFLLLILVAMAVVLSHRGNSPAQATIVPFVGCKSDGQVGPQDAPTGEPKTVTISPELAQMIAYYKASDGSGVLAPRGWYCFGTYGSSGSNLIRNPNASELHRSIFR